MPWNEATREQYTRPRDRFESDVPDEEWALVEPLLPRPSKMGRPREHGPSGGVQRGSVPVEHGMPVAGDSPLLSAVCNGSELFLQMARHRGSGPHAGRASRPRAGPGGPLCGAERRRDRQPVGEDDGERRPRRLRRRQEDQGAQQAACRGGRRRVPDRDPGPRGLGAGTGTARRT